jgi:putative acetyltransferase
MNLRKTIENEAPRLAFIHRSATEAALPFLPDLHTPEEDLAFYRDVVMQECDVWILEEDEIMGFIALKPGWIDHLYVATEHQGKAWVAGWSRKPSS